jgi:hypothetical protein
MPDRIPCEFFLIRYVPDVVKGEFVNIGVLLREAPALAGTSSSAPPLLRFTRDWSRVRCIDPDADIALLEGLEAEIGARLHAEHPGTNSRPILAAATRPILAAATRPILGVLSDSLSNSVQITEPRATLAENLSLELDQLLRLYVEPVRIKQPRTRTGRAAIAAAMRSEFERAGAWPLMRRRISAALYTRPGDPMKLDCGYKAERRDPDARSASSSSASGIIRIFHAVSLANDVEAAKGLAYTAPQLRDGVRRVEAADLELTAVVEPLRAVSSAHGFEDGTLEDGTFEDGAAFEDEAAERYRFGVDAMEREQIRVLTVSDLARAAETARIELRI